MTLPATPAQASPAHAEARLLGPDALRRQALARAAQRGAGVARRRLALRWLGWSLWQGLKWGAPVAGSLAAGWWLWQHAGELAALAH